jgi:CDP-glycerol glycerophosphotransferase (TagB/SpsB family)
MTIQKKHFYHGCALAQIVEHQGFTSLQANKSLDKASDDYGHYIINTSSELFIKFRSAPDGKQVWHFKFDAEEVKRIRQRAKVIPQCFVALVCAPKEICLLDTEELGHLINLRVRTREQTVTARLRPGCSFTVQGSEGELPHTVRRKRFPEALFCQAVV